MSDKSETINILLYRAGEKPVTWALSVENQLRAMQALVGGYVERISIPGFGLYCNEDGRTLGLPLNREVRGFSIRGNFFVARENSECDLTSLTPADNSRILDMITP